MKMRISSWPYSHFECNTHHLQLKNTSDRSVLRLVMPTAEFRQPIFCPCTSVNSQQMERKIQFLKANFGANFDAIGFFKEFKFMNKKDGESDLIDVVNAICSWKSDSDVKRWALEMKQNGFKVNEHTTPDKERCFNGLSQDFRTEDTERYWTMVAEEASAFAQQKAFAAIRKSVYEDMENERAESPEVNYSYY